ncbi:type II secretion system F family protein [Maritimibacter sp. UBA3975]|uniref:type II secretion system F family protein n=1 Tax=Maritimibacter sp. UBA3975 TaxID=1946833 RepID=UPI000C0B7E74|nr:type II secretion system F family protein [Maritimibacter sp. UBA3975]MAM62286.1 hypothetical protein [Maritimibacter sp.]|tara:strand:- start:10031 stop:10984 length:954 start_codon:yes stop_codon:yes gene_type:complete
MAGLTTPALLVGLAALALMLVGLAIWQALRPGGAGQARLDRMRRMQADRSEGGAERLRKRSETSGLEALPLLRVLPVRMRQAGMSLAPRVLLMLSALVTSVLFVVMQGVTGPLLAFAAAAGVGVLLPGVVIGMAGRKRAEALTKQLPEALDLMKRGLSVGHPLNVTIQNVSRTLPAPIADEFRLLADQVAYGDSLTDAVDDMAARIDIEDFHYLAAAVQIQHATGGNLGAMLETLARVIRMRFAMRRRVAAVSSEGRITAFILSAMPFVMYLGTVLTAPDYYASVRDDPMFWPLCFTIAGLVIGNGLLLRKLVTFRV